MIRRAIRYVRMRLAHREADRLTRMLVNSGAVRR